jgi:hypothetical protein
MSWVTDYFDSFTYGTSTTGVGAGVNKYYDKRFLRMLTEELRLIPFGQKRPLPEGNGTTIDFFRWLTLAQGSRTLTEGINPNAAAVTGQKLTCSLAEYGNFGQPSSLLKQGHIDVGLTGMVDIFAEDAATTLDTLCHKEICSNGCYPLAADLATTSTYSGTTTSVTSTTVFADTALASNTNYGDANDDLNQSVLIFTSGPCKGEARTVNDYVTSGGSITVSPALNNTPDTGDTFVVTTPDEITAGDNLDYTNIRKARTLLKWNHARTYSGNAYIGLIDPDQSSAMQNLTEWKNIHTYKDQTRGLFDGEVGKFGGVRWIEHTNPFRFPVTTRGTAGTSYGPGATGANWTQTTGSGYVTTVPVFGRDAFGVTTFAKKSGQARKPSIIIKNPGPGDTSNPLNRYSTVGWEIEAVYKGLQALHMIGIWCQS